MKKYKDIIMGSILFAVGLVYFIMSFSIRLTYIDRIVGSRMFPQICGVLLMGLSLWLVASSVRIIRRGKRWNRSNQRWEAVESEKSTEEAVEPEKSTEEAVEPEKPTEEAVDSEKPTGGRGEPEEPKEESLEMPQVQRLARPVKTLLVLVSFAVFCWLLDKIGFGLAAFIYLFTQMMLISGKRLSVRDVVCYFILSIALAAGIYFLFFKGFSLMLPKAGWFS